jgi:hypothetical protein
VLLLEYALVLAELIEVPVEVRRIQRNLPCREVGRHRDRAVADGSRDALARVRRARRDHDRAPALASPPAIISPMPLVAPVTTASLPATEKSASTPRSVRRAVSRVSETRG